MFKNKIKKRIPNRILNNDLFRSNAKNFVNLLDISKNECAKLIPQIIKPEPTSLFVSLTSNCNNKCIGCNYGQKTFMQGNQLNIDIIKKMLNDAESLGFSDVRLYGGEPLLYNELEEVVSYCIKLGLHPWLTTNGILLNKQIDQLYNAGLRDISFGLYGIGSNYDKYTGVKGAYKNLINGLNTIRNKGYKDLSLKFEFLLMKPTCSINLFRDVMKLVMENNAKIYLNLVHYSLPYFPDGYEEDIQFKVDDRDELKTFIDEVIKFKKKYPKIIIPSLSAIKSIPDWLIKKDKMKIPCDRNKLIWIGADGSVQMCYAAFPLGNLNNNRLNEMLFTKNHNDAAKSAFELDCPNCHCSYNNRINNDLFSRIKYAF